MFQRISEVLHSWGKGFTGVEAFKQTIENTELPGVVLARGNVMSMVLFLALLSFFLHATPKGRVWFFTGSMKNSSLDKYIECQRVEENF